MDAARKRGWQVHAVNERIAFYRLEVPDGTTHYIRNITSSKGSGVLRVIAAHKDLFYEVIKDLPVTTPPTLLLQDDMVAAQKFLKTHGTVVVKPTDQGHGDGVTVAITTIAELKTAIARARMLSRRVILQKQITGDDYRLLYIDGNLAAAVIRRPAFVTGDGLHTLEELIALENRNPNRGEGYQSGLTNISLDSAEEYLGNRLQDVPMAGVEVQVVGTANIGKGGTATDMTDTLPALIREAAEVVVNKLEIGLGGLDFIVDKSGTPYLIELNNSPSLGLHEFPDIGVKQNTPDKFLDWLQKP